MRIWAMKKTYEKPTLVRRNSLAKITETMVIVSFDTNGSASG
jgi:hypothetical protein